MDAETKYVCVDDVGLAARGSYEPTDALGGVLADLEPWQVRQCEGTVSSIRFGTEVLRLVRDAEF